MYKFIKLAKKHKIKIKELTSKGLSSSYLSKIKTGKRPLKEEHLIMLTKSFNRIFHERGIAKEITINDLYDGKILTPDEILENLINRSIVSGSLWTKEGQDKIEKFAKEKEVHSCKYRYLIAKHKQKQGLKKEALELYKNILQNFACPIYFYSILVEVTRLEKVEKTYEFFRKYKKSIDKAPTHTKALLYYNTGVNLLITKKWKKGIELFSKVIDLPIITKHYYHSYNNLGSCYQKIGEYELAIDSFKKAVDDPTDSMKLKKCYINILSAASDLNNEVLMRNILVTLEEVLSKLEGQIIYQTYWNLGKAYLKLGEQKKAIESFEKELSFPILTDKMETRVEKYLDSIEQLMYLYGLNSVKQQQLIEFIVNVPINLVSSRFLIKTLNFYIENSLKYEAKILIKKFNY